MQSKAKNNKKSGTLLSHFDNGMRNENKCISCVMNENEKLFYQSYKTAWKGCETNLLNLQNKLL